MFNQTINERGKHEVNGVNTFQIYGVDSLISWK